MRSDGILFKHIDYLIIVQLLTKIVVINSLKSHLVYVDFFRWALYRLKGGGHMPQMPIPLRYAPV